jgi:hypothetical protein
VDNATTVITTKIKNAINVYNYHPDIYTNPQLYVKPKKLKASITVTDEEIRSVLPGLVLHTKFAIMADPYLTDSDAAANYTKNDESVQRLPTKVTIYKPDTVVIIAP